MSLATRLLNANPGAQVSTALTGALTTPGAKGAFDFGAYESISTVTVGAGGSSSISFTSIPATYSHLQLRCFMRTNLAATTLDSYMVVNAIASYEFHYVYGNGATPAAGSGGSAKALTGRATGSTATASTFGVSIIDILDYANTNKNKVIRVLNADDNNGNGNVFFSVKLSDFIYCRNNGFNLYCRKRE